MNTYISIDFGTCHSVISYIDNEEFKINHIFDRISGDVLIPTTIYFNLTEEKSVNNFEYNKDFYIGNLGKGSYFNKK